MIEIHKVYAYVRVLIFHEYWGGWGSILISLSYGNLKLDFEVRVFCPLPHTQKISKLKPFYEYFHLEKNVFEKNV